MSRFNTTDFTPTQFTSAVEKQNFAEKLASFVEQGFKQKQFSQKLYKSLSNSFQHIAHFNRGGFYATWFTTPGDRLRWVDHVLSARIYGDPTFTPCDVERAFQTWLEESLIRGRLVDQVNAELESRERAELKRLSAKYPLGNIIIQPLT